MERGESVLLDELRIEVGGGFGSSRAVGTVEVDVVEAKALAVALRPLEAIHQRLDSEATHVHFV